MTTDERLDRLTERHEALTQSVEMVLTAQRETAAQVDVLTRHIDTLTQSMLVITDLVRSHENRLNKLESSDN